MDSPALQWILLLNLSFFLLASTFHRNEFEAESSLRSGRQCGVRLSLLEAPGNKCL